MIKNLKLHKPPPSLNPHTLSPTGWSFKNVNQSIITPCLNHKLRKKCKTSLAGSGSWLPQWLQFLPLFSLWSWTHIARSHLSIWNTHPLGRHVANSYFAQISAQTSPHQGKCSRPGMKISHSPFINFDFFLHGTFSVLANLLCINQFTCSWCVVMIRTEVCEGVLLSLNLHNLENCLPHGNSLLNEWIIGFNTV